MELNVTAIKLMEVGGF